MEPRVGETYNTTKQWNYKAMPRTITRVIDGMVEYRVKNMGMTHSFTVATFHKVVSKGLWRLAVPSALRLPAGV